MTARLKMGRTSVEGPFWFVVVAAFLCLAGWVTHIVWIIKALASSAGATVGQMVLGALGAFMPPIGIIHGWIIWFS